MADGVWDHVGIGECEDSLVELARRVELGEPAIDVPNFVSWKNGLRGGEAVRNNVGEFPDLTRIPAPDYGLFDTQRILDAKQGWFGLLSSRCCPYRCTYCLNHRVVDTYRGELGRSVTDLGFFRYRPIDLLLEEIADVLSRYNGIGTFILDDDLFTQNADHAIAFCDAYAKAGFGVPFVVNSHVKRLDPRIAAALGRAGCRILKLGIESGSERVRREVLKRFMTDDDILATVAGGGGARAAHLRLRYGGTARRVARRALGDGRHPCAFGDRSLPHLAFLPFPGTESYQYSIDGGYVDANGAATLTDFTESSCLDFGADENLFIDKLAVCMPWLVNARLDRWHDAPASARYGSVAR